jgi:hypothetical protein
MENEKNTKQDCGCSDGCCTPKKSKPWMKILFAIIIIAALAIVTFKLVSNNNSSAKVGATISTEKSGCGDSSSTKSCEGSKDHSCCSQKNK